MRAMVEFLQSVDYVHIVPQIVREPDRFPGLVDDPYGADFLERMASTNANTRKARLRRMVQALQLAVPQLESLEVARDKKGRPHLKGKYRHWRSKGAWQAETTFSDGTLRLIGLLWALQDGKGPLLLEEPELSLHPYIVRNIPRIFIKAQQRSPRQVILSTHSPEMLGDEGIGLDEVLVLTPEMEGTRVGKASDIEQITLLMEGGMRLADAILPYTAPRDSGQLTMLEF